MRNHTSSQEHDASLEFSEAMYQASQHNVSSASTKVGGILDVDDLALRFRCSREKIKRSLRSNELRGFKFGNKWFVREEDLEQDIAAAVESRCHLRR